MTVEPMDASDSEQAGLRHASLAETAQDWIADQILKGMIKPGQKLAEVALAEQMGISRSPVREALRSLSAQGLVIVEPRRGAFVAEIDLVHAHDLYDCRLLLEPACVQAAVGSLTASALLGLERLFEQMRESALTGAADAYVLALTEYNRQLLDACPNRILLIHAEATWRNSLRYWGLLVRHSSSYAEQSLRRNSAVHAAVRERDADAAGEAVRTLLEWSRRELAEVLTAMPAGAG